MVLRPPKVKAIKSLMYLAAHLVSTAFFIMVYDCSCRALPAWCYIDAKNYKAPSVSYRAVNGVKGTVLGALSVPSVLLLMDSIRGTQQLWWFIPYMSTVYASLDMAALLVLKDMHISTTVHHVTVQFLHTYLALNDFDQGGLARPIVTFACFSCLAFLANIRLALRGIPCESPQDKRLMMTITDTALQVYVVCCVLNAGCQLYLLYTLYRDLSWFVIIAYLLAVNRVATDDIILIKWLLKQKRKMCSRFKEDDIEKEERDRDKTQELETTDAEGTSNTSAYPCVFNAIDDETKAHPDINEPASDKTKIHSDASYPTYDAANNSDVFEEDSTRETNRRKST